MTSASEISAVTETKLHNHFILKTCWQHDAILDIAMNESAGQ